MSKKLVIVESPAKSKTIQKYLGPDYKIMASYGHIRDLKPKEGAVDPENDFQMHYEVISQNKKHADAIKKAAKEAEVIYLATDPDREGEAISWHIHTLLKNARLLKDTPTYRVAFNEITKTAVQEAIDHPRDISMDLVNAQQARRALDYLVGFNLSPLLWKKIRRGLSAGRVQSPALRMIVEREKEIEAFTAQEYWSIKANVGSEKTFDAKLTHYQGQKLEQFSLTNETDTYQAVETIKHAANDTLTIINIDKKQKRRNPYPPFITSTLQQEASKQLGFSAKKTMMVAQQLYEGIDVGAEGAVGLITYMRTDATHLSNDALMEIRDFISQTYGSDLLPKNPRIFKTKSQNAQEAHEAIRPTQATRQPEQLKSVLSTDQLKLYTLIWKRTIACQMIHATMNTVAIDLATADRQHIFRATGSTIAKKGYLTIYQAARDEDAPETDEGVILPELKQEQTVCLNAIMPRQHFTEPPPRYTEASLVKALEAQGIGRPSTYASIISTLVQREYVALEKKRFCPTDVGRIVNDFLKNYFKRYVEYSFTARLENDLDDIAAGKMEWIPLLEKFWQPFIEQIKKIDTDVKKSDVTHEKMDEPCPECGSELSIRLGKNGRFVGCTNYPTCRYTRQINEDGTQSETPEAKVVEDRNCPECGNPLHIKQGRYGQFIGCSNYPECRHMEPLEKPKDTGITCPKCQKNPIVEKKSRKGKVFFACSGFPKCKNAYWYPPIDEPCPQCDSPILLHKTTKKAGQQKVCPACDYSLDLND